MGKVIVWIVIVVVVMFVLRMINVAKAGRRPRGAAGNDATAQGKAVMVQCVDCGIYLPRAEALAGPRGPCCGDAACRERANGGR